MHELSPPRHQHVCALIIFINSHYFIAISIILGTGEEAQQPEQLEEQDQADEVLKVHEQLLLTFKEIEKEMESLGNTFAITFESYTLEARGQLPKIQVYTV